MPGGEKEEAAGNNPAQAPNEDVVGDIMAEPTKKAKRKSSAGKRKSKRASSIKKEASKAAAKAPPKNAAVDKEELSHAPDPPESEAFSGMKEQLDIRYSLGGGVPPKDLEVGRNSKVLESKKSSVLNTSDDPFATREGKSLLWRDINMILAGKKDGEKDRHLLEGVWGEVPQRKTTAIMGPSGRLLKTRSIYELFAFDFSFVMLPFYHHLLHQRFRCWKDQFAEHSGRSSGISWPRQHSVRGSIEQLCGGSHKD